MKKMKKIIAVGLAFLPFVVQASFRNDSVDIDRNFDSLINAWHAKPAVADELITVLDIDSASIFVDRPDSFYIERLNKIPSVIQLTYNDIVKKCIGVYTIKKRDKLEEILGLKDYYFPVFENILDQYNVPLEFKYLAVIESALNPRAVSRCGATGLWQFMLGTGKLYKLNVNSFVDQRRDAFAATHAAARYLRDLYAIYGDWGLVIAAYNCGPGNVNKAIRRSGGKKDYWEIYNYLPRETRSYYPLYIAATYALNYYKDHNVTPRPMALLPASDTMMVNENIHLQQVADVMNLPIDVLRDLNPQYRRDIVPGKYATYPLRVPAQYATKFIELKDSIVRYKKDNFFAGEFRVINPANSKSGKFTPETPSNAKKIYHKVEKGQTLAQVADKYNVNISDLRYWNDISSNKVKAGKKLVVYVSKKNEVKSDSKADAETDSKAVAVAKEDKKESKKELKKETKMDKAEKAETKEVASKTKHKDSASTEYITYKVKTGDTIWKIANDYKVDGDDLLKWNNISDGSRIKPGQTIRIKKIN